MTKVELFIDQDLCTGDGICVEYAPDIFEMDIDGLAYVKNKDVLLRNKSKLLIDDCDSRTLADIKNACKDCPGECIFIKTLSK